VFLLRLNIGFAASAMSESRKNDRFPGLSAAELEERASNGEKFKNLVGGNAILNLSDMNQKCIRATTFSDKANIKRQLRCTTLRSMLMAHNQSICPTLLPPI
jgi:hypothetical protein